tara:strand:+ start:476 stop:1342 length:867 start_codon:yes stop_codon:yes gene_type:complete
LIEMVREQRHVIGLIDDRAEFDNAEIRAWIFRKGDANAVGVSQRKPGNRTYLALARACSWLDAAVPNANQGNALRAWNCPCELHAIAPTTIAMTATADRPRPRAATVVQKSLARFFAAMWLIKSSGIFTTPHAVEGSAARKWIAAEAARQVAGIGRDFAQQAFAIGFVGHAHLRDVIERTGLGALASPATTRFGNPGSPTCGPLWIESAANSVVGHTEMLGDPGPRDLIPAHPLRLCDLLGAHASPRSAPAIRASTMMVVGMPRDMDMRRMVGVISDAPFSSALNRSA